MNKLTNKSLILGTLLLLSISFISASYGYEESHGDYYENALYNQQEREQVQNKFENRYQYECKENQTCYYDGDNEFENLKFKIREQKQLNILGLKINVEQREEYVLSQEGEIIQSRYNIWSRLLNQERIRI